MEGPGLHELYTRRFPGREASPAEKRLLEEIPSGNNIDLCPSDKPSERDPGQAGGWGPERTASGEVIGWLCMDREAARFVSHRGVRIRGAKITGDLGLDFANLPFPMVLRACAFEGEIHLEDAHVKRLDLSGSHTRFVSADGAKVEGSVFLREKFKAHGVVRLVGAMIGGDLGCAGGEFANSKGNALLADRAKVEGDVFLRDGFKAQGRISLVSSVVAGFLVLKGVSEPDKLSLDLESATVGTLQDEQRSWPSIGNLHLNGFTYTKIARDAPRGSKSRIAWLRLQPQDACHPQPYEFLARTMKEAGFVREAKRVAVAKSCDMRRVRRSRLPLGLRRGGLWLWDRFLYYVAGYGYYFARALSLAAVVLIVMGWIGFHAASTHGIMVRTQPPAAPAVQTEDAGSVSTAPFHPFLHSLDLFLPFALGYEGRWEANESRPGGFTVHCFGIGMIVTGWALVALGAAAATGVLQRRT